MVKAFPIMASPKLLRVMLKGEVFQAKYQEYT